MKRIYILITLFLCSIQMMNAQEWVTDFGKAKEIATQQKKTIILVFQGSDWCAPCIKLEREVWQTDVFKDYAATHFVMLKADFPKRKKNVLSVKQTEQNNKLAEVYNKNGYFPLVVVLDKNGKILGETGYKKLSPQEYIKLLNSFIK
uniref:thioredoxin family protein n=1 Tax=Gelidibacter sp. TaxID=2018083 RepID=UPI00404B6EB9